MEAYRLVCPSRKRTFLMGRYMAMFPYATVTVDESEMDAYAPFVPKEQLVPHPPFSCLPEIRNWILDTFTEPCIVMSDDDICQVKVLGGHMRGLKRAADLQRLIENGLQIAEDLDIGLFGWNPSCPLVSDYFVRDPISLTKDCAGIVGIRGPARHRRYDLGATGRADVDFTLQALAEDRIVLIDLRFHFDVGTNQSLKGGALGLISEEQRIKASDYTRKKWGNFIALRPTGQKPKLRSAVPRRQ